MPVTAADILVRPVMSASSGLVEDEVMNDWAFRLIAGGAPTNAQLDTLMGIVGEYYRGGATAADRVGSYIGTGINRAATHRIEAYSISAGGSAIRVIDWLGPVTPIAGTNLPTEVAAVLSFHGNLTGVAEEVGATRPRARRRGRVFIGPLTANATTSDPQPRLDTFFTAALRSRATVMHDDAEAAGWRWSVWSRSNTELYAVTGGWTDNAPDTQRRRGQAATARTVFTT